MMHRSLVSAGMSAAIFLSLVPSALALSSDEIMEQQLSFKAVEMCEDKTGTLRGRCITDVMKRISILREAFKDALELERTQWYADHSYLGISAEYTKALQEFTKEVSAKRKAFNDQQREIEKLFYAKQKEARIGASSSSSSSRGYSRPVTNADLTAAQEKCAKQKDKSAQRICLRTQLRLMDPNARQMGAGLRTIRGQ